MNVSVDIPCAHPAGGPALGGAGSPRNAWMLRQRLRTAAA
jgi:hypothetical protein